MSVDGTVRLANEFCTLAGQARAALPALNPTPALADASGDWADERQAVGDGLVRDVLPLGGLRRLARAHRLLMAILRQARGGGR